MVRALTGYPTGRTGRPVRHHAHKPASSLCLAAFYGQNTKIRETLNNLILKSPQDWQTGVALPFVRIVGTTVEWDE